METVFVGENKLDDEKLIDVNAHPDDFPRWYCSCWRKSLSNSY
jgi:hypothetical protein